MTQMFFISQKSLKVKKGEHIDLQYGSFFIYYN